MAGNTVFDDLVLKAKDIADAASKKTGEIYEISKTKYECIKLNGEVKKLYEQLGSSVYSMVKGGYDNHDLVESLTEEIDEKLARLRDINDLLAEKKKQSVCPACNLRNSAENTYCAKCGAKLRDYPSPSATVEAEPEADEDDSPAEAFKSTVNDVIDKVGDAVSDAADDVGDAIGDMEKNIK